MKRRSLTGACLGLLITAGHVHAQAICGAWSHSPTPSPNEQYSHFLGVAAISAADVWAVGEYDSLAGTYTPLHRGVTAHWNGVSWSLVPTPAVGPSGTTLTGVAGAASNDVWAVGYSSTYGTPQTLAQRWDGAQWSVVPSPVITGGSSLAAITRVAPDDYWAVGNRAGGLPEFNTTVATLAAHWNGSAWSAVPSPNVGNRWNDLVAVSATSANDVWAVGSWRNTGELYQNLAMHWNGSQWSIVPTPNAAASENELAAVAAIAPDDVWAVGHSNDGITVRSVFLHWNGASWTSVPGPGGGAALAGGAALVAIATDDVWVVGSTTAHWDGSSWTLAPNPAVPGAMGMALAGAAKLGACDVWAVGAALDVDAQRTLAVHLAVGGGSVNQPPVAVASATPESGLAPLNVQLSSAGSHDPDGTIVSYLWDFGDSTYPPNRTDANPVHTYIQTGPLTYHAVVRVTDDQGAVALASATIHIDTPVHVESQAVARAPEASGWAGENVVTIANPDGQPVAGVTVSATYEGPTGGSASGVTSAEGKATLRTTPSAVATSPWCFTVTGAAGSGVGYEASGNVVTTQCESSSGLEVPQGQQPGTLALAAGPSPCTGTAFVSFVLPTSTTVSVQVLDATGRLVRDLLRAGLPAGRHEARWDGMDARGAAAPAGVYFVRLSAGSDRLSTRLLRLR